MLSIKKALIDKTGKEKPSDGFPKPQYYDMIVDVVLEIRQQSKQMVLTFGHYLKQLCLISIAEAIKQRNKEFKSHTEEFCSFITALGMHRWLQ